MNFTHAQVEPVITTEDWDRFLAARAAAGIEPPASARAAADAPLPIPTELLLWEPGEPALRTATKVGGVPALPAARPWPLLGPGRPMSFVAQWNFREFPGLFPPEIRLPGDLLLFFAEGVYLRHWWEENKDSVAFEWVKLDRNEPLIDPAALPRTLFTPAPARISRRIRTFDLPPAQPPVDTEAIAAGRRPKTVFPAPFPQVVPGAKVGGLPPWISHDDEPPPGTFLASLTGLEHLAAPTPEPPPLRWGDRGLFYLFLGPRRYEFFTVQVRSGPR